MIELCSCTFILVTAIIFHTLSTHGKKVLASIRRPIRALLFGVCIISLRVCEFSPSPKTCWLTGDSKFVGVNVCVNGCNDRPVDWMVTCPGDIKIQSVCLLICVRDIYKDGQWIFWTMSLHFLHYPVSLIQTLASCSEELIL